MPERTSPTYPADSRIAHALRLVQRDHPNDPQAQAMSLRAELLYSAFLTPADRRAFRAEIERREAERSYEPPSHLRGAGDCDAS